MRTRDDAVTVTTLDRVFTSRKLSDNMEMTPEGFLLCRNVALARIGPMDYGPREVPDEMWKSAAQNGRITVMRMPEDVFAPTFVDSLQGKPVVITHPQEDVTPDNWKKYEVGICLDPRRGGGDDNGLLIGDLLIKDVNAIKYVREDMPEISLGYEADYQEYEERKWKQVPLIANHIALVNSGRCGPRCAIHDTGENIMKSKVRDEAAVGSKTWWAGWKDRLAAAIKTNDAAAVDKIANEIDPIAAAAGMASGNNDDIHIHLPDMQRRVVRDDDEPQSGDRLSKLETRVGDHDTMHAEHGERMSAHDSDIAAIKEHLGMATDSDESIEGDLMEEAPQGTGVADVKKARDSALFADSFQAVRAGAEILCPGIALPTYDRALTPRKTFDAMCQLRRKALDRANMTPEGREAIESINGGRSLVLDGMKCGSVRTLFNSTVALVKTRNVARVNDTATQRQAAVKDNKGQASRLRSAADINKANAEFYKGK